MDWNFLCGEPNNSTNWFSVHCIALGQQLSSALCSTLWTSSPLHSDVQQEHCGEVETNTVEQLLLNTTNWFSVHCSALEQQLSTELCSTLQEHCGQAPLLFAVECSAPTLCSKSTGSSSLHSGMLCTSSVEQALVYFVEQQLSSTLWCAAGPTTHSLDTETLDREGPIFMVMCHFWHRGTAGE